MAPDKYFVTIIDLLEKTDSQQSEEEEGVDMLLRARINLQNKCDTLVMKNNDLEEKNVDLVKRYDVRTDQLGKLSVKNFIFATEIKRIMGRDY